MIENLEATLAELETNNYSLGAALADFLPTTDKGQWLRWTARDAPKGIGTASYQCILSMLNRPDCSHDH
jgi:hypothetical protein